MCCPLIIIINIIKYAFSLTLIVLVEYRLPFGLHRCRPIVAVTIGSFQNWCGLYRSESLIVRLETDPHSPGKQRYVCHARNVITARNVINFKKDVQPPRNVA